MKHYFKRFLFRDKLSMYHPATSEDETEVRKHHEIQRRENL